MSYFTIQEEQQKMFTQLPKALLYEDIYKPMSNDSKVLYSFLIDRVSLSAKNGYVDEQGRVYIKCSEITMAEILNKTEKTVRKFKKELIDKDLLEQADAKNDKTKYYVKQPKVTVAKLEDYIADFQEVVKEKTKKELERNKEYRLRKANNKVADLKAQFCNGNNDRSIENTELNSEKSLEPLQSLATVENTVMHQSKLPFSNNEFSNTDLLSMYVCTGTPAYEEIKSPFIQLAKDYNIIFNPELEGMIMSYEEVFTYELYEYLFFEILNKYRNGRVNDFGKYLLSTLDTQSSKGNFTLEDYLVYKADFNEKTYRSKTNNSSNNKKPVVKKPAKKEEPTFVPSFEPTNAEPIPVEELPEFKEDVKMLEKIEIINFRKENNLNGTKYINMSLEELKQEVKKREELESKVDEIADTYNKVLMTLETRRYYARKALGLI